jgi:outer membrane protein insertion porin family
MSSLKLSAIAELPSKGDEISIIPLDEKFIMGGNGIPYGNALRGYPDNSVGPQTSGGSPTGGNTMLKFSTEFRFPFSQNPVIYALIFADMGNVWRSHNLLEPFHLERKGSFELKRSVGAGIRFFMPMVGMLGFDIGYGFDDILGSGEPTGWNTTITFGQQF